MPTKPLDHWTATSDGRVIDASGATVCVCYQLPLDPVPADTKAKFIAKACNSYHAHVVRIPVMADSVYVSRRTALR